MSQLLPSIDAGLYRSKESIPGGQIGISGPACLTL
jgi:hypothetical protein